MYIVLEGITGSGKTTQTTLLEARLKSEYPMEIVKTREPGGDIIAEKIREIVQNTDYQEEITPITEAYGYAASRAQTLRSIVLPAHEEGAIVIADRSVISSIAYQGYARGLGVDRVRRINEVATEVIKPDLIIFLDIGIEDGLYRLGLEEQARSEEDKFEGYGYEFHKRVLQGYYEELKREEYSEVLEVVDATRTEGEISNSIFNIVEGRLKEEYEPWKIEGQTH